MVGQMSTAARVSEVTESELDLSQFTQHELEQLRRLRENYPYIEYTDSRRQWHRLRFAKWLYSQGQLEQ